MEEILFALLRGIGYFLAEILFYNMFYYIGWAFIKIITLGREPVKPRRANSMQDTMCGVLGLLIVLIVALYFFGFFG